MWSRIVRWIMAVILAPMVFVIPLVGVYLTLLGCILVAPDIAGWLSKDIGGLLWSRRRPTPTPLYGIPESLVARERYEEAERAYEEIIREFPDEVKPHVDLINIAVTRLHDLELAKKLYTRGLATLKDQESKNVLTRMYSAIASRIQQHNPNPSQGLSAERLEEIRAHLQQGGHGTVTGTSKSQTRGEAGTGLRIASGGRGLSEP